MPPKRAQAESQWAVPEIENEDTENGIAAFELPKSLVTRIAKGALPSTGKMQKDVPAALQKSATVFISYLTAQHVLAKIPDLTLTLCNSAQEIAAANNQKTLSAQHVLEAVRQLPWSDASDIEKEMQEELRLWRDKKSKPRAAAPKKPSAPNEPAVAIETQATDEAQPSEEEEDDEPDGEPGEEPDDEEETQMDEDQ